MMIFFNKLKCFFTYGIVFFCLFTSCTIIRNYPINKPFVYSNSIQIDGNIKKDEKKLLTETLNTYWDDSLLARKVMQFGVRYILKKPPTFDTVNINRTVVLMNNYLNSQGYYYAQFKPSFTIDTLNDQLRTNIKFNVNLGKNITIDSVSFLVIDTTIKPIDSTLENITLANSDKSILKKNTPYTKQNISNELSRLTELYRNNGYFKFNRENLFVQVDTLDASILQLTTDPTQQINLLKLIEKKRNENPNWDITVMLRTFNDSNYNKQYYIGNLFYYPDLKNSFYNADSLIANKNLKSSNYKHYTMLYNNLYTKLRPLKEHTFLKNKTLYNEKDYYKSINRLGQMAAWKQVDVVTKIRDKDSIDFHFFMIPEKKYGTNFSLEVSRNTGDIASGNLLGIGFNSSLTNRNIWKQAIQSLTTARVGIELNIGNTTNTILPLVQTTQLSVSHTYNFPRIIQPFRIEKYLRNLENQRTLLSISGNYTDRTLLYTLKSFVTSFGWEANYNAANFLFKPINVELYRVDTLDGLKTLLQQNPFLRNAFRDGNVIGSLFSYSKTFNNKNNNNKNHFVRISLEESGTIMNLFSALNTKLFSYGKVEGEYKFLHKQLKSEIATRFFIGAAIPRSGQSIPIFKQYFMGGPNSMRAWGLRQLGLGSSKQIDTTTAGISDRFGDLSIEANFEYRFNIATLFGFKIGSALYTDIGNLWNISNTSVKDTKFSWQNIGKDLAIGIGTGLRIDISYVLIRFDLAYKLKDPARPINNGWMSFKNFEWTNTRENGVEIPNFAFQFGIGLPF